MMLMSIKKISRKCAQLSMLLISAISCFELGATHIVGSDMTFTCNAKEWFEIELTVRRDCINGDDEAIFDDPAFVGIYDAYGTPLNWLGSLGLIKMDLVSVEDIPIGESGACSSSTENLCVSEARYVGQVFLPFREKGYILGYQRCCRNVTLNNIVNPLETGMTSFVCITEETLNTCNSSPQLGEWPDVVICAGDPLIFDASATDADGDSLAYKIYTPHSGATLATPQPIPPAGPPYDTVTYAPGFSLVNQLGSGTPLTINSETGEITATPGAIGQFLVGILVEEWRDGQELSKTRRQFEYNVVVCDGSGVLAFESVDVACDGLTVDFTNTSTDLDRSFTWNFNYPSTDPTFISNEVSPSFTFPDFGTYEVRLTSAGDEPTCNSEFSKTIRVVDSDLTASCSIIEERCQNGLREITVTSTSTELSPLYEIDSTSVTVNVRGQQFIYQSGESFFLSCSDSARIELFVQSSSGCTEIETKILEPSDSVGSKIQFVSNPLVLCSGESSPLLINVDPSCTYTWSPTEGLDLSDPLNPIASPNKTTTYVVVASNEDTTITDSVVVEVILSNLMASCEIIEEPCENGFRRVTVNSTSVEPDRQYTIDSTRIEVTINGVSTEYASGETFLVSCMDTGSVHIFVRSTSGCTDTDSKPNSIGTGRPASKITFAGNPIEICQGQSSPLLIDVDPSCTYTWSPTEGLDLSDPFNPIASPTETTTYVVTASNEDTTIIDSVVVEVLTDFLDLSIINNGSECGDTANLTALANNFQDGNLVFEWSTDPNFENIVARGMSVSFPIDGETTIYLRGGGADICGSNVPSIDLNGLIGQGIGPEFNPINTCVSDDGRVAIVSDDPNEVFSVEWEPSENITSPLDQQGVDIVALPGQTEVDLVYTITTSEGCISTDSLSVPVEEDFEVAVSGGSSVCTTSTAFYAESNIDSEFVTYQWALDSSFSTVISISDTLEVDLPDGTEVFLRGSSSAGCESDIASGTISTEEGSINSDAPRRICVGDTAMVNLSLPPSDNLTVAWDASPAIISNLEGEQITILGLASEGETILYFTASNEDGCEVSDSIIIPNSTVINPNPDPQVQCGTNSIQLMIDSIYEDGDVFWDFGFVDGQEITSTEANPLIDFGMAGVFNGTLSSTMETCNFDPFQIFFEVPEILEIESTLDENQEICMGDSLISLGATSNGSIIVWTDQDGNLLTAGDSVTVDVREISRVIGTVTDAFGCSDSITFNTGFYEFDITLDLPMDPVCSNDPIMIGVTNNRGDSLTYMWVSANGIESGAATPTPTIIPGAAEDLVLIVTNELGCTMEFEAGVAGGSEIEAEIIADPDGTIVRGESVTLTVVTDAVNPTFLWSNGSTEPSITVMPEETTTYTVVVTDENGCTAEASYTVMVDDPPCDESGIFIPDAFSPNNDASNDLLFVRGNGIETLDFQVLDRWGKEVFRTNDQDEGWNGRHRQEGKELSPDVYAYCVKVTCFDGTEFIKAGNVSLLR